MNNIDDQCPVCTPTSATQLCEPHKLQFVEGQISLQYLRYEQASHAQTRNALLAAYRRIAELETGIKVEKKNG